MIFMKKILITLFVLVMVVGCTQPTNNISYQEETNEETEILYIYGDLNEDKLLQNLEYKTSTCWQHMRSDITDDLVGKYDQWNITIYTDANFIMIFGYTEDEEAKRTTYSSLGTDADILKWNQLKNKGYSFVESVQIDDRYGFIVDVSDNKETQRVLYINDNGGRYEISFRNQTDSLSSLELQFAYDYIKSLHFNNATTSSNS